MTKVTTESIIRGLTKHDSWVCKAVTALAEHGSRHVLAQQKFQEYGAEYRSFGTIEDMNAARHLCIANVEALLAIASRPRFDFRGKSFVLTGKLENFTRNALTAKLEGHGAFVGSAVSPSTDVVIVGSKPGAKFRRAESFGTVMWNESELMENLKPKSQKS